MVHCAIHSEAALWPNNGGADDPLSCLKNSLVNHSIELVPGDVVLVGTSLSPYPVEDGDEVVVCIPKAKRPAVGKLILTN